MSGTTRRNPLSVNNSKINSILSSSINKKGHKSLVDPSGGEYIQLSQDDVTFINTEATEVY